MGRPPKDIDAEMVRKLAKIGCTQKDIAEFFHCAHSVISERFRRISLMLPKFDETSRREFGR